MSDDQIAASSQEAPKDVRQLRDILVLMDQARPLTTPSVVHLAPWSSGNRAGDRDGLSGVERLFPAEEQVAVGVLPADLHVVERVLADAEVAGANPPGAAIGTGRTNGAVRL